MSFVDFDSEMAGLGPLRSTAISQQAASPLAGNALGAASEGILGGTDGLGGNIWGKGGAASMALGGLQTLGSIWNSFQQMKMARKTLGFQKKAFKTNLENSVQVYNTALEDRIRARYATEGRSEQADAKIAEHSL